MQNLGIIFQGVTNRHIRNYLGTYLKNRADTKVIMPCAGKFTLCDVLVKAGFKAENIFASDITLYSTILGYFYSGRDLSKLGIRMKEPFEWVSLNGDDVSLAARVLVAMKYFQI